MAKVAHECLAALKLAMRRRSLSAACLVVLGIGGGVASAIFAFAEPFIVDRLPFRQSQDLALVTLQSQALSPDRRVASLSEWRLRDDLFTGLAAFANGPPLEFNYASGRVSLTLTRVTTDVFQVLGDDAHSRSALTADAVPMNAWLTETGLAKLSLTPPQVGATITTADGTPIRIRGTLRREYSLLGIGDIVIPSRIEDLATILRTSDSGWAVRDRATVIARLKKGISPGTVEATLSRTALAGPSSIRVELVTDILTGDVRSIAFGALALGALVLVVCAGNLANLFLTRVAYRRHELATRRALGATTGDIALLLIIETVILAMFGLVGAIAVAELLLAMSTPLLPAAYARFGLPSLSLSVLCVGLLAVLIATLAAATPAILVAVVRRSLTRDDTRGASASARLRFAFAAAQTALATMLVVTAGLVWRSYADVAFQRSGYDESAFYITVKYPIGRAAPAADINETLATLEAISGVKSVAAISGSVVNDTESKASIIVGGQRFFVAYSLVTQRYFDTVGIPIVRGRLLASGVDSDYRGVVVNESLARLCWPGTDAINRAVTVAQRSAVVVGVVPDVLQLGLSSPPEPALYALFESPRANVHYVFAATGYGREVAEGARLALGSRNPGTTIGYARSIGERLDESIRDQTLAASVLLLFAVGTSAVALTGISGLAGFAVAWRRRELAIRLALGAGPRQVVWLVARDALAAALVGSGVGVVASYWFVGALSQVTFGLSGADPLVIAGVVSLSCAVFVTSGMVPARRALRADPAEALRPE